MSLKKISKVQPELFEFNSENLQKAENEIKQDQAKIDDLLPQKIELEEQQREREYKHKKKIAELQKNTKNI